MTDAIDEARAALERELYKYLPTDTCAQDRKDIRSAAVNYALAYLDAAAAECINCQDADPEEREELTQRTGHGWCDAHRALRARLERASHD